MSIESAKKFIKKMRNDKDFSKKILACKNSDSRIKLIKAEGLEFSIPEIMEKVNNEQYRKNPKNNESNELAWLEIVAVWCVDRRRGWRGDAQDRSVRHILNDETFEILCPHCSQQYFTTEDYSGRALECEVCSKVFSVSSSLPSDDVDSVEQKSQAADLSLPIKISENNIWKNWK